MSDNSTTTCAPDDNLCITREHQLAVIIVPTLLFAGTLITLIIIFTLLYCPPSRKRRVTSSQRYHSSSHRRAPRDQHRPHHHHHHHHHHNHRGHLHGIDAPPGINPLEHEELPMSAQQNVRPTLAAAAAPPPSPPPTERQHGAFSQLAALPYSLVATPDDTVNLYRARMENRNVVLRVLKDTASSREKRHFLGFASFVTGVGPHPFLPALLGVVSVRPPLMMVVEELQHRDLLGFLWRCRQDNSASSCDLTEKTIFTMATQVASALKYLHGQNCVHGNVGARSVLVGGDLTAKLWGLGPAYRRRREAGSPGEVEGTELKKWQAPEVLSRRLFSPSSDVWSFGILLYEMVTLGDPPFAEVMATDLLPHLQRGNHLGRPPTCSNSLFAIIRFCCRWNVANRLALPELINKLNAGERSANGRTVLRVPEPIDYEKYLREAGHGEAYSYAVL